MSNLEGMMRKHSSLRSKMHRLINSQFEFLDRVAPNPASEDESWEMRVREASLLLISILEEGEDSGRKVSYDPFGWPEFLMARVKERFENFDDKAEERHIKFINDTTQKELDK